MLKMEKLNLLYEGKAKQIYQTTDDDVLWVKYKDNATAFNNIKKAEITGKGHLNNEITSILFSLLKENGIENHFIEKISDVDQLVKKVTIIPLEVVVRNVTAGSLAKRLGFDEGVSLSSPIVEFYFKDDELGDPIVTEDHIAILGIATPEQLLELREKAFTINRVLRNHFEQCQVRLIDFKLEFGIRPNGEILLADEISPDTCRLWDKESNKKLDKDNFRRDLGSLTEAYQVIYQRLKDAQYV